MLATLRWASSVPTAMRSSTWPVRSMNRSRIVNGPSRQVSGVSSSRVAEEAPELRPGVGRDGGSVGRRLGGVGVGVVRLSSSPVATISRIASTRWRRSNLAIRATWRISSASSRHGPAVIIRVSATSSWGSAMARRRLLEVADLRQLEQRQPADDRVRDVLVAQPGDDRVAVLVLAVEDGDVRPARLRPVADELADRVDDDDRLVLRARRRR